MSSVSAQPRAPSAMPIATSGTPVMTPIAAIALLVAIYKWISLAFIRKPKPPGLRGGVLLQLVNPKSYAVNAALFSGFVIYPDQPTLETVLKFIVMNAICLLICLSMSRSAKKGESEASAMIRS